MTSTSDESAPVAFQVGVDTELGASVVAATGEIDMMTVPRLEKATIGALDEAPPVLVIDLTEVTFLSSAGLALLARAHKLAAGDTEVRIVAAGPATLRPLQLMGLDQELRLYSTRDEAIATGS